MLDSEIGGWDANRLENRLERAGTGNAMVAGFQRMANGIEAFDVTEIYRGFVEASLAGAYGVGNVNWDEPTKLGPTERKWVGHLDKIAEGLETKDMATVAVTTLETQKARGSYVDIWGPPCDPEVAIAVCLVGRGVWKLRQTGKLDEVDIMGRGAVVRGIKGVADELLEQSVDRTGLAHAVFGFEEVVARRSKGIGVIDSLARLVTGR